jgi:glycosyltransferase involved in cell wall biosynthesis
MYSKIDKLLHDSRLRRDLINKGKTQTAKYSWRRMAEQTLKIYEQALK